MKKQNNKQRLFEITQRLDKTFKPKLNEDIISTGTEDSYDRIIKEFPGHAKYVNPVDSPQYKWYLRALSFIRGNNDINEKAELVKFFQNNFFGIDYSEFKTPEELVAWWLSPSEQEFIKDEINAEGNNNELIETGEWSGDKDDTAWMEELKKAIEIIATETGGRLKLIDIKGFDKYQGPYAIVEIDGRKYNIWTLEEYGEMWIEDFPYDNTSGEGKKAGFQGTIPEIINVINSKTGEPKNKMYRGYSLNEEKNRFFNIMHKTDSTFKY